MKTNKYKFYFSDLINQSVDCIDWQSYEDQAEEIIKKCADAIRNLKEKVFTEIHTAQYKEHLENIFYLLNKYLKGFLVMIKKNFMRDKFKNSFNRCLQNLQRTKSNTSKTCDGTKKFVILKILIKLFFLIINF